MPTPASRRRFIAGAVCPRCAQMDKLVVDLDTDQRECVACGFKESRPPDTMSAPAAQNLARELSTRVTRPAARRPETAAEPVRLVDPRQKAD